MILPLLLFRMTLLVRRAQRAMSAVLWLAMCVMALPMPLTPQGMGLSLLNILATVLTWYSPR